MTTRASRKPSARARAPVSLSAFGARPDFTPLFLFLSAPGALNPNPTFRLIGDESARPPLPLEKCTCEAPKKRDTNYGRHCAAEARILAERLAKCAIFFTFFVAFLRGF